MSAPPPNHPVPPGLAEIDHLLDLPAARARLAAGYRANDPDAAPPDAPDEEGHQILVRLAEASFAEVSRRMDLMEGPTG